MFLKLIVTILEKFSDPTTSSSINNGFMKNLLDKIIQKAVWLNQDQGKVAQASSIKIALHCEENRKNFFNQE